MSRRIMLSIAAATIAVATIASQSVDARSFAGARGFAGRHIGMARVARHSRLIPILGSGRHPIHPIWVFHHRDHLHRHWVFRGGRWIDVEVDGVAVQTPVAAPAPCTCLTKTYTPSGLVVFADVCTKESASAPAGGSADATQVPTTSVAATAIPMSAVPTSPDYAGRTYEDYLAANPQAAKQ
jgi:hypothetical protein